MKYWQDKVVLVTGGSAGLGLAIARAFAQAGSRLVLAGRNSERLARATKLLAEANAEVLPIVCDVTSDRDVAQMMRQTIDHFGQLDVVVNNAGRSSRGLALETSAEDFQAAWELNCLAPIRVTQAVASELKKTQGHVVNIGSLASKTASPFLGAYPATKHALAGVSHQFRIEFAEAGVHVLLVCPGPIQRDDAGSRYDHASSELPAEAKQPGGGVKLSRIDRDKLAAKILKACERRQLELVVPGKAKWLFAVSQLWPSLGDWIVAKFVKTGSDE